MTKDSFFCENNAVIFQKHHLIHPVFSISRGDQSITRVSQGPKWNSDKLVDLVLISGIIIFPLSVFKRPCLWVMSSAVLHSWSTWDWNTQQVSKPSLRWQLAFGVPSCIYCVHFVTISIFNLMGGDTQSWRCEAVVIWPFNWLEIFRICTWACPMRLILTMAGTHVNINMN